MIKLYEIISDKVGETLDLPVKSGYQFFRINASNQLFFTIEGTSFKSPELADLLKKKKRWFIQKHVNLSDDGQGIVDELQKIWDSLLNKKGTTIEYHLAYLKLYALAVLAFKED